jgi:cytochrome b subunit of formate dehydrogenase
VVVVATTTAAAAAATATTGRPSTRRGGDSDTDRVLRNRRSARRLHAGTYLVTAYLFLSGISLLGEGRPSLEALLGGHLAAAQWHRWVGYGLIGAAALVIALRPRSSGRFLADSVRFRGEDLRWFASYPAFLLRPSRNPPARHGGHFDPGQRVFNVTVVVALAALSISGVLMSFPQAFTPATFAWSLRIHRLAMWAIAAAVTGHVLVASGVTAAYRGVWRAMHGDGRVSRELAERLWPGWAEHRGPDAP